MLEAKDTMMSDAELTMLQCQYSEPPDESVGYERNIAKAQAEISFKAGIKEVVEDFNTIQDAPEQYRMQIFWDILGKWQAFLKELDK